MKKILHLFFVLLSIGASAQIFPDGTTISSFSATDINNNFFSSTMANNNGKHIIIDFSATWCTSCWGYHGTKVLDNYNKAYGPNGTMAQDAEVLFYEGDASTNSNDLNGVGTNTVGDWVTGTSYHIFNEATPSNVISSFTASGFIGFPSVFVVCSDKKMYRLATSIVNVEDVRSFVEDKCGMTPLSTNTVYAADFSYEIYPNPSAGDIHVKLNLDKPKSIAYSIYSSVGQKVLTKDFSRQEGDTDIQLETSALSPGMYMLNVSVGSDVITEKIIIE